jgi:hypothetical protein
VIHRDNSRLMATRVTVYGEAVDETPIVLADLADAWYAEAAVTWADSHYVVAWSDGRALHSLTVSREGAPSAARTLDLPTPLEEDWIRIIRRPRLSYDGSEVLLVWSEAQRHADDAPWTGELPAKTWATRLDKSGALFDLQPPLDLEMDGPSLSVASSGFDFMVVAGQHARVLKGDGPLRVTAARDLFGWRATSDVTWDDAGNDYAVALRYYGSTADWYLAMLRLDSNAIDTGARLATATLTPDEEAAPSIAFPTTGIGLIGVQEGTAADGVSATVYRHFEMTFIPSAPGPPRNVRVQRISRSSFEVNWNAPAGGDPDSYIVEQFLGDTWIPITRVEGNVRSVRIEGFDSVPLLRVRAFNAGGPSEPAQEESGGPRRRSVR